MIFAHHWCSFRCRGSFRGSAILGAGAGIGAVSGSGATLGAVSGVGEGAGAVSGAGQGRYLSSDFPRGWVDGVESSARDGVNKLVIDEQLNSQCLQSS